MSPAIEARRGSVLVVCALTVAMACGTDPPAATAVRGPAPTHPSVDQTAAADRLLTGPDWYRHAVFYEVNVRSFQDSNGDGIGDLAGLTSRLDYLKELGIDALWLMPIFPTGFKDSGYDVADYRAIDPAYGDLAAFDRLLTEAHTRKMRVFLDLVLNHTSDKHAWFQESRSSKANAKADWYLWSDTPSRADLGTCKPDNPRFGTGGSKDDQRDVARFWLDRGTDENSDREPGEAQAVEHRLRERHGPGARVRATHIELDQVAETHETVLSRPTWVWGAEMGANEHGLAIGNEAVFTRVPVEEKGLLGMDLVRLALERCATADEALELVTRLLAQHGQGGRAGFRDRRFAYHNAFLIADPGGAWLLETAGRFWAAERVRGARSTSNVLTIGAEYTLVGPGTIEGARSLGLLARGETFDFRKSFASRAMGWLSGGDVRRARTAGAVGNANAGLAGLVEIMRGHAGKRPEDGMRLVMPCAHASWLPTRGAGQTTGTMVSRLARGGSTHLLSGTSAPCLSVMKSVPLGGGFVDTGPTPRESGFDGTSLWWRAERLHRAVLKDYDARRALFETERAALEARAMAAPDAAAAGELWREHRELVVDWTERVLRTRAPRRPRAFDAWWRMQSRRDGVPA